MDQPFSFTETQTKALHKAMKEAGLRDDANWPHYLGAIERVMRMAQRKARLEGGRLYAGPAKLKLQKLQAALAATRQRYDGLGLELQLSLDAHVVVPDQLAISLPRSARSAAEQLLLSGRFPYVVEAVREAVSACARTLNHSNGLFPKTGKPRSEAMKWAVQSLWAIYEEATGRLPKAYSSAHAKEGYAGGFYIFAAAALGPARLVPPGSLGSKILSAYKEYSSLLKTGRPKKKVKSPSLRPNLSLLY